MRTLKAQRGMSMWSGMFVIAVVAFFLFLGFKLFPPYMENFKVKNAIEGLARDPSIGTMTRGEMIVSLEKRFDIDNVDTVKPAQHLFLETRGRTRVIRITYEAVVPLFGNISALLDFQHVREVRGVE